MGTDPTDASSHLQMTFPVPAIRDGLMIQWQSIDQRTYRVLRAEQLSDGFDHILATGIESTPPVNTYVDDEASGPGPFLYRVELE
jgi:hypothetical protein